MSARTIPIRALIAGALLLSLATPAFAQGDLAARVAAYKQRVTLLEDQDAIENLQATYGYYFDKGLWAQAAALFSKTGSFEYGQRGVYVGPARIQRAMLLFGPEGLAAGYLNTHMMLQPYVVVAPDGRTATARWQGMMQLAHPRRERHLGRGRHQCRLCEGRHGLEDREAAFLCDRADGLRSGFTKSALPVEGPSALFPPDKPATEAYRSFPGAYIPPFNFNHRSRASRSGTFRNRSTPSRGGASDHGYLGNIPPRSP